MKSKKYEVKTGLDFEIIDSVDGNSKEKSIRIRIDRVTTVVFLLIVAYLITGENQILAMASTFLLHA